MNRYLPNRYSKRRPIDGSHAFTLIELLVVVAIIAVLIGILVSALTKARERANATACLANLKGIGTAVQTYAAENNDVLPDSGNRNGKGDHASLLRKYTQSKPGTGLWVCPSHDFRHWWRSSYGFNWAYLMKPGPDYPHDGAAAILNPTWRQVKLKNAANVIMYVDHTTYPGNSSLWTWVQRPSDTSITTGWGRIDFRHSDQANVLFVDGHGGTVPPEAGDPAFEDQYWNPR